MSYYETAQSNEGWQHYRESRWLMTSHPGDNFSTLTLQGIQVLLSASFPQRVTSGYAEDRLL